MKYEEAAALLEKYWAAETTLEEETSLAGYFRGPVVDERLAAYRDVFVYFEMESARAPGEGLEARILKALEREERLAEREARRPPVRKARETQGFPIRRIVYYAAVAAVLAGLAFLVVYRAPVGPLKGGTADGRSIARTDSQTAIVVAPDTAVIAPDTARYVVKDTYQDPRQALAAVQKALLRVSRKMNHGKDIAQRRLNKLNDSWTKAVTD